MNPCQQAGKLPIFKSLTTGLPIPILTHKNVAGFREEVWPSKSTRRDGKNFIKILSTVKKEDNFSALYLKKTKQDLSPSFLQEKHSKANCKLLATMTFWLSKKGWGVNLAGYSL